MNTKAGRKELYRVFVEGKKPASWLPKEVKNVFDHEPFGGDLKRPACITITTDKKDAAEDTTTYAIRIYVDATVNAGGAADLLDDIIDAIDSTNPGDLGGGSFSWIPAEFSIPEWQTNFEPELGLWAAIGRVYLL